MEIIITSKKGTMPFEEFDYASWIESKIEKRPFAEIVRKKTMQ